MCWFCAGTRGALWDPSFGRAVLGGLPCLFGAEYVISDCCWGGALENVAAPFWCAEKRGGGKNVKIKLKQHLDFCTAADE